MFCLFSICSSLLFAHGFVSTVVSFKDKTQTDVRCLYFSIRNPFWKKCLKLEKRSPGLHKYSNIQIQIEQLAALRITEQLLNIRAQGTMNLGASVRSAPILRVQSEITSLPRHPSCHSLLEQRCVKTLRHETKLWTWWKCANSFWIHWQSFGF